MPTTSHAASSASQAAVVIVGRLGSRVDTRELPSGDTVTVFTIVVDRPRSRGAAASAATVDAIPCQSFRADVNRRLERLNPGDWVIAEGTLRRRFWRTAGGLGSAMEVEVSRLRRTD